MSATNGKPYINLATPHQWESMLQRVFERVSGDPRCTPILRDIGSINFQLTLRDRPDAQLLGGVPG